MRRKIILIGSLLTLAFGILFWRNHVNNVEERRNITMRLQSSQMDLKICSE